MRKSPFGAIRIAIIQPGGHAGMLDGGPYETANEMLRGWSGQRHGGDDGQFHTSPVLAARRPSTAAWGCVQEAQEWTRAVGRIIQVPPPILDPILPAVATRPRTNGVPSPVIGLPSAHRCSPRR
ncbi:hypothetical protein MMC07_008629 [Pseudocyphellaria aurata]|nr:hypothetical protein [Pseudocyphellaria aurata]